MSYGCKNRAPLKTRAMVQDGWNYTGDTRTPRMVVVPFRMAPDCQYVLTELGQADPGCVGCSWKTQSGAEAPV